MSPFLNTVTSPYVVSTLTLATALSLNMLDAELRISLSVVGSVFIFLVVGVG